MADLDELEAAVFVGAASVERLDDVFDVQLGSQLVDRGFEVDLLGQGVQLHQVAFFRVEVAALAVEVGAVAAARVGVNYQAHLRAVMADRTVALDLAFAVDEVAV